MLSGNRVTWNDPVVPGFDLTRPLGASMGDLLTQPNDEGGLALGTIPVSVVFCW